ncbi:MAG: lipocalin family protein [Lysobacterales bacterium]
MTNATKVLKWAYLPIALTLVLGGCLGVPDGARPVENFALDKYLGKWYEIARLDHPFERGLTNVTAEYSLRDGGGVEVINRGFKTDDNKWKEAEGKAYFVGDPSIGKLKVSFFGPFYGAYNVIALDEEAYQWSLVVGPDTSYLWILSRTPELDQAIVDQLLSKASLLGFDTEKLIWVNQQQQE